VDSVPMNDLARAAGDQRAQLRAAIDGVLASGWFVHGAEHAAFEEELAAFVGVPECAGVANGTDALELAIRAFSPPAGSVVVTAANAGTYASTAARRAGCSVRYADVDRATMNLEWATVEPVLDDAVSVVIVTHLYGRMADAGPLLEGCARRGIRVVEDCAQAIGATGPSGRAGSLGDAAAFSFYPTKNLGAVGDGGAVATRLPEIAEQVRCLRQYGWSSKYTVGAEGGRNSRLDEIQAAVLRVRLPLVEGGNERRRAIIGRYAAAAAGTRVTVAPAADASHAAHLAVALSEERADVRAALAAHGVQTDVHYPLADHRQQPFAATYGEVSLPVTEWLQERIFSLPCFPELTEAEIGKVCDALAAV
jgi:dTDP-3-amino-2,3,6-trideoxy-4-keto-D-glucose/dTDP-3-amino-3,4,6-trideoxy-alpha-D-glucose/dTDP-2,6-dideoxy-D-kanosamine transaminase